MIATIVVAILNVSTEAAMCWNSESDCRKECSMKQRVLKLSFIMVLFLTVLLAGSAAMAEKQIVRVSAAANLTDALKTIGGLFTKANPEVELQFNFGSSGALAKQIDNGAPADLFFSANAKWMDHLVSGGKVISGTVRDITGNALVVVSLKARPLSSMSDITGFERIAMGSPGSVPVGEYTEQALRASGIYETLVAANKLVLTKDVRQALLYADRGEADISFVYKTDALLAEKAKIVFTVPEKLHKPIVSNMGLTVEGGTRTGARAFYDFVGGSDAGKVFESYGYVVIPSPVTGK